MPTRAADLLYHVFADEGCAEKRGGGYIEVDSLHVTTEILWSRLPPSLSAPLLITFHVNVT